MSKTHRLASGAVAAAVLVGCSTGPVIHATIGRGSTFCTDLETFAALARPLGDAANQSLSALQAQVTPVRDQLQHLYDTAPAADNVDGHPVKTDLQTELNVYTQLVNALQAASPSDPNAVANALDKVNTQQGEALTAATGRLDSYTRTVCGVTVTTSTSSPSTSSSTVPSSTTSTTAGGAGGATTTTGAPVGPVGPSTTAAH